LSLRHEKNSRDSLSFISMYIKYIALWRKQLFLYKARAPRSNVWACVAFAFVNIQIVWQMTLKSKLKILCEYSSLIFFHKLFVELTCYTKFTLFPYAEIVWCHAFFYFSRMRRHLTVVLKVHTSVEQKERYFFFFFGASRNLY